MLILTILVSYFCFGIRVLLDFGTTPSLTGIESKGGEERKKEKEGKKEIKKEEEKKRKEGKEKGA